LVYSHVHHAEVADQVGRLICIHGRLGEMSISDIGSRLGKPRGFGGYRNPCVCKRWKLL
jgi:hypothetical protein